MVRGCGTLISMVSSEEHFVGKVAQKALILNEAGEVLLVRDVTNHDTWGLPGGRLNADESPIDGLVREVREEVGLAIDVVRPISVGQFLQQSEGKKVIVISYLAKLKNQEQAIKLQNDEVCEARFVPIKEALTLKLFPEYRRALEECK